MNRTIYDVQPQAFQALFDNSAKKLDTALKEGAKPYLNRSGGRAGQCDSNGVELPTLIDLAVLRATNMGSGVDILLVLEQHGGQLNEAIERIARPEKIMNAGNECAQFLKFVLTRWPTSFGKWEEKLKIHDAVSRGDLEKTSLLLTLGMRVDDRNSDNLTPLMMAQDANTVRFLLEHGADLHAVDRSGKTAVWHRYKQFVKKITKLNNGNGRVNSEWAEPFIEICGSENLKNDPHAFEMSRKLRYWLDKGLTVKNKGKLPGIENISLASIIAQVNETRALFLKQQLEKELSTPLVPEILHPKKGAPKI